MNFTKRFAYIALSVFLLSAFTVPIFAGTIIGYVLYTDIRTYINGMEITSYNINDNTAVVVEDLTDYGFDVKWDGASRLLKVVRKSGKAISGGTVTNTSGGKVGTNAMPVHGTDIRTYLEGRLVYSCNVGGRTIIYADDLADVYASSYKWDADNRTLKLELSTEPVSIPDTMFIVVNKRVQSAETGRVSDGKTTIFGEGDEFPFGYVEYPNIEVTNKCKSLYPKLSKSLISLSEELEHNALSQLATETYIGKEFKDLGSCFMSTSANVERADSKVFSILFDFFEWSQGVHPNEWFGSAVFDAQTGERLSLNDVITDMDILPKYILDNLEPTFDYEFSKDEKALMLEKIKEYVKDGSLIWTLDNDGFHVYFYAYMLQSYAFGPIYCHLSYKDHTDLIKKKYVPTETVNTGEIISYIEDKSVVPVYSWKELEKYYSEGN